MCAMSSEVIYMRCRGEGPTMPGAGAHFAVVDQAANNLKKLEQYIVCGMDASIEVAGDLVQYDKEKSEQKLQELRGVVLAYASMEQEMAEFMEAVSYVKNQVKEKRKADGDVEIDLEILLKDKLAKLKQQRNTDELLQHDKYIEISEKIAELKNTGESVPEVTQYDQDVEVAMTQQEIVTKCPYTMKEMKEPVKNSLCGHSYEKDAVREAMKQRRGKTKCPVAGCINEKAIDESHLVDNKELRRFIDQKHRSKGKGKGKTS